MSDHDELLARAETVMGHSWVDGEVYDLIRDLRAALAARPDPDPRDAVVSEAQAVMRIVYEGYREDIDFRPLADALVAATGSAAPTGDDDERRCSDCGGPVDSNGLCLDLDIARPEPSAIDMVTDLHRAVYGDTWARPESPQQMWEMLLGKVRGLASGWCGECERRVAREDLDNQPDPDSGIVEAAAGSAAPTGDDDE